MRMRFVGLALIAVYAALMAIAAWSEPRDADTPPIMLFMMMMFGFMFLGVYFLVRFANSWAKRKTQNAA